MQLQVNTSRHSYLSRSCTLPIHCPHCGDPMIAPALSEFIDGGEIRHHWACDACGEESRTLVDLVSYRLKKFVE